MKAVEINKTGGPEVLELKNITLDKAKKELGINPDKLNPHYS